MHTLRNWLWLSWPALAITAVAFTTLLWVVRPVFSPIGLGRYDTASLIRHTFPVRLVQPQWIADQSNLYFDWSISEARARFTLVAVCWLAGCVAVIYTRVRWLRTTKT